MKWISVKDKLPNIEDQVCVTDGKGTCVACYDADENLWLYGDAPECCGPVTHWQPLPEPPNTKESVKPAHNKPLTGSQGSAQIKCLSCNHTEDSCPNRDLLKTFIDCDFYECDI